MEKWMKLDANKVMQEYLVSPDIANDSNNSFYDRKTKVASANNSHWSSYNLRTRHCSRNGFNYPT